MTDVTTQEIVLDVSDEALFKVLDVRAAEDDGDSLGLRVEVTGVQGVDGVATAQRVMGATVAELQVLGEELDVDHAAAPGVPPRVWILACGWPLVGSMSWMPPKPSSTSDPSPGFQGKTFNWAP